VSYNATISACEKGNQWQSAWHLFHQISQHHLQPLGLGFLGITVDFSRLPDLGWIQSGPSSASWL
jgi:pentatricopeptide repeat protein